ncbi:hypothetical protein DDF83_13725 [Mycobacterium tuberculosis]|nr:hypothetical protein DDF83_13725 [Mycobacterium tuberculosis]
MTSSHLIDTEQLLADQLAQASPDLLRGPKDHARNLHSYTTSLALARRGPAQRGVRPPSRPNGCGPPLRGLAPS